MAEQLEFENMPAKKVKTILRKNEVATVLPVVEETFKEKVTNYATQIALARRQALKAYQEYQKAKGRYELQAQHTKATEERIYNLLKEACDKEGIPFDESSIN